MTWRSRPLALARVLKRHLGLTVLLGTILGIGCMSANTDVFVRSQVVHTDALRCFRWRFQANETNLLCFCDREKTRIFAQCSARSGRLAWIISFYLPTWRLMLVVQFSACLVAHSFF